MKSLDRKKILRETLKVLLNDNNLIEILFQQKSTRLEQLIKDYWRKKKVIRFVKNISSRFSYYNNCRLMLIRIIKKRVFYFKGFIVMSLIYLKSYLDVMKYYMYFCSLVLIPFFRVDFLILFFPFFRGKSRFMFFFNFIRSIDKFYIKFFNFFILYKKIKKLIIKINFNKINFFIFSKFFLPFKRFFVNIEIFCKGKIFLFSLFDCEIFSFVENKFKLNKYIIFYDIFFLRIDFLVFFLLYKYNESFRMLKYNEYLLNCSLFCLNVKLRYLYIQRYFYLRLTLYVVLTLYFKMAIVYLKILIIDYLQENEPEQILTINLSFSKMLLDIYKNNFFVNFLLIFQIARF